MNQIISIANLSKTYATGFQALKQINLEIRRGEIFALLGPNGAGKTTLIGIVCGIVNPTDGTVTVDGHDVVRDYRAARSLIGLVPQELTTDAFETVWTTVSFSRGLWGKPADPDHIAKVLKALSLWDKKDSRIFTLSGGMKRRVLIAKALSHEPQILFLDEPTAGVDVELRKDMWEIVRSLRVAGVTIILTTHYIEEAERLCDRVAIVDQGRVIALGTPRDLKHASAGTTRIEVRLTKPVADGELARLEGVTDCRQFDGAYVMHSSRPPQTIVALVKQLEAESNELQSLEMFSPSLEDAFIELTGRRLRE